MTAARQAARANWTVAVTREVSAARDEQDDLPWWLSVPVDERARTTWELSRELYVLAARNGGVFDEELGTFTRVGQENLERRLPRSAFVITRR